MSNHEEAYRANVGVYDRDFRNPGSGLPRCEVCDIFIGNDMSDVHAVLPEHMKRLSAQQGIFK